jgi:hypothetical protein
MWRPGETLFDSADRNGQPTKTPISGVRTDLEPPTTGFFATNYDVEYLQAVVVGDRLLRRGAKLVACQPKETKVGRGAFLTWESEIVNQRLDVVARLQTTYFRYNPHSPEAGHDAALLGGCLDGRGDRRRSSSRSPSTAS